MKKRKWNNTKWMKIFLWTLLILAVGIGGYAVYGHYKIGQLSEMTFEEMLEYTTEGREDSVITVGIIKEDSMSFVVYGEDGRVLPNEEHVYEIGSITKTFTASLLMKAVSEERLSLDDSIDRFLALKKKDYYPTVRRLVTHTSGYKGQYFERPMIGNYFQKDNAFHGITKEMNRDRLEKTDLDDMDYPFSYSNFGMATLGAVLEEVYKEPYVKLMNDFIATELGLNDTKISEGTGNLDNYWSWSEDDAYLPAGALLSDITDMMEYTKMNMEADPHYLGTALRPLKEVVNFSETHRKMGIYVDQVAAGWMIDRNNQIIWHNGGTGSFNSYLGFDAENQIGVVILSNLSPGYRIPATVMGVELLTSFQK